MKRNSERVYWMTNENWYTVNQDKDCFELTKELHDYFKETNGATCCRVLIKNFPDRNSAERKAHCIEMVKTTVVKTAEIIMRELNS